jgi:hypothetical protein
LRLNVGLLATAGVADRSGAAWWRTGRSDLGLNVRLHIGLRLNIRLDVWLLATSRVTDRPGTTGWRTCRSDLGLNIRLHIRLRLNIRLNVWLHIGLRLDVWLLATARVADRPGAAGWEAGRSDLRLNVRLHVGLRLDVWLNVGLDRLYITARRAGAPLQGITRLTLARAAGTDGPAVALL